MPKPRRITLEIAAREAASAWNEGKDPSEPTITESQMAEWLLEDNLGELVKPFLSGDLDPKKTFLLSHEDGSIELDTARK